MKKILLLFLTLLILSGCQERTMRYTANKLESNIEKTSWSVTFSSLDGNLTEGFILDPEEYTYLHYNIAQGSGKMIVQVKQQDQLIELPHEQGTLPLKNFKKGSFYLQILGEGAKDGRIYFEWSKKESL